MIVDAESIGCSLTMFCCFHISLEIYKQPNNVKEQPTLSAAIIMYAPAYLTGLFASMHTDLQKSLEGAG